MLSTRGVKLFFRKLVFSQEHLQRLEAVEKALKRLIDDVEELDDKYTRIRGLVYARKLHKDPQPEQTNGDAHEEKDTSKMTRMELKQYLARSGRFLPGKPPKHSE